MRVLLGSTAVPPGTYKPTAPAKNRLQLPEAMLWLKFIATAKRLAQDTNHRNSAEDGPYVAPGAHQLCTTAVELCEWIKIRLAPLRC